MNQSASPERFHDNNRYSLSRCRLQSCSPRLRILIHIVILNLAEIPVIGIQNLQEHFCISVKGKADIPNLSGFFLSGDPLFYAKFFQTLPFRNICKHMHQVVIHMICLQPGQFFVKISVNGSPGLYQILRELCGYIDFIPDRIPGKDFAQRCLASRIDIRGIKVIDPQFDGVKDFSLCFLQINPCSFSGKPHTPEPQN